MRNILHCFNQIKLVVGNLNFQTMSFTLGYHPRLLHIYSSIQKQWTVLNIALSDEGKFQENMDHTKAEGKYKNRKICLNHFSTFGFHFQ